MSRRICRLSSSRAQVSDAPGASGAGFCPRENDLDLDRYPAGQRAHADSGAGMPPALAKHLDKQIGAAVDDFRMILEIGRGIAHPEPLDNVFPPVEIAAERILYRRDQHEPDAARVTIPFVDRHAGAELA